MFQILSVGGLSPPLEIAGGAAYVGVRKLIFRNGNSFVLFYRSGGFDCNDSNRSIYEGAPESRDGIDNNCDDLIDEGCPCLDGAISIEGDEMSVKQNSDFEIRVSHFHPKLLDTIPIQIHCSGSDICLNEMLLLVVITV